ncbi:hypothetical protein EV702DRAFT_1202395 [Suillus placidus]|uniref:Uncharacterized protein n=1 Tax=Suillus placidus TaxID=48579 RepID=A0A9P6ZLH9_9AGAM|nr:hypothetical protein EV702DRAFT_1202395 [Suillus placidus]
MDVPKTYEHMGWRLSAARRMDLVHRLLTTQDLESAFKAVRTEQNSGRKKKKVVIEIANTNPGPRKSKKQQADSDVEQNLTESHTVTSWALLPYTKELENVKNKLWCSEHRLALGENTFCWVDVSQPNTPHYLLCTRDLQEWAKYLGRSASLLQCVPTELISPVIHNHVHLSPSINTSNGARFVQQGEGPLMPQPLKRTFALYMESDEESEDDEPLQNIDNVLTSIHLRYPAMNFLQYLDTLREHGILYLPTAAHFGSGFYKERRFTGQGKWADAPSAAELCFTQKHIGGDADMSMIDVQKGKDIFFNGIRDMPDEVIQDAVLVAQAECEYARLLAISSAWGLEKIERCARLQKKIVKHNSQMYADSMAEASFFEALLVKHTRTQLEDDADFTIAAYVEDFTSFTVADLKLDQLEDVADARKLDLPMDDATPDLVVNSCLESIIAEVDNIYAWPSHT